jgi:hypothetical protein
MRLWREIVALYELNPVELHLLGQAARQADLVDRLQAALEGAPLVVKGSMGQPAASPLVSEVRQHRTVLAQMLQRLRLQDSAGGSGARSARASDAARRSARARWGTPIV